MHKLEAVIFDWAGTTVDYGCFAPVNAFKEAFKQIGIEVSNDEVRAPMGMLKIDHIKTMLAMPRIENTFLQMNQRMYNDEDVNQIYQIFETELMKSIAQYTEIKPFVLGTVKKLRELNIKIGSTTGYTNKMMAKVVSGAQQQGYEPDCWFSPDSVEGYGRPYPYMIYQNLKTLEVLDIRNVVKVGDTVSDIKEGKHAGCISVGILEGSSEIGLSEEEYQSLNETQKQTYIDKAKKRYLDAGADYIIMNLNELIPLLEELQLI